jgi:hypothetical protein
MKYDGVSDRIAGRMTRAQAMRLKNLADEAYQPGQYAPNLSFDEPPAVSMRSTWRSRWRIRSKAGEPSVLRIVEQGSSRFQARARTLRGVAMTSPLDEI